MYGNPARFPAPHGFMRSVLSSPFAEIGLRDLAMRRSRVSAPKDWA